MGAVHATGAMASMTLGGVLAARAGYDAAFLSLAAVAALGAVLCRLAMPETRGAPAVAAAGRPAAPGPLA